MELFCGSKNKFIPHETFNAPQEFLKGLINGYTSGDGCITKEGYIQFSSVSEKLIEGLSFILGRFNIFGKLSSIQQKSNNILRTYCLTINSHWLKTFAETFNLICESKQKRLIELSMKIDKQHLNFDSYNDVVLDKISKIEKIIDTENYNKVYDLTIPSTLNFGLTNGLIVRDTAETGYIQRRLVKALEDISIKYDNTVRNSRGMIVQFLYGEDGLDATYLENVDITIIGLSEKELYNKYYCDDVPEEYENLKNLHEKLMHIAKNRELNNSKINELSYPMPAVISRIIKFAETIDIDDSIPLDPKDTFKKVYELTQRIANIHGNYGNGIEKLRSSNASIIFRTYIFSELAYNNIKHLSNKHLLFILEEIELKYKKAIASPGEMCGVLAAQSIGEPATQMTLNSVEYGETLIIDWTHETEFLEVRPNDKIGKFIDYLIEKYPEKCQLQPDGHTIYLPLDEGSAQAMSADEDGNVMWTELEAVTRHPPINKDGSKTLVKVKTKSGREHICTKAKSFLIYDNKLNKLIEKEGSLLELGDKIPLIHKMYPTEFRTHINLKNILDPMKNTFTDYMIESKNAMIYDDEHNIRNWFHEVKCKIPYSRSDSLRVTIERPLVASEELKNGRSKALNQIKTKKCKLMFKPGMIYPLPWGTSQTKVNGIPSTIELDRDFGFLIGAYLAEGCVTDFQVIIANNDEKYRKMATSWSDKHNIFNRLNTSKCGGPEKNGVISTQICIHSTILRNLLTKICGIDSYEKRVPEFAYSAPDEFVEGLLDAYICGDGSILKNGSMSASSRSMFLRDGIALLLSRYGIYTKITENLIMNKKDKNDTEGIMKPNYILSTDVIEVTKLYKFITAIDYKRENLSKNLNKIGIKYYHKFNETLLDEIIKIEDYESEYPYVYDLTVAKTRNMVNGKGAVVADTFHHAGISEKNVTLGVPRLKELINVTKKPKTPSLTLYEDGTIKGNDIGQQRLVEQIRSKLEYKTLHNIIKSSDIIYYDSNNIKNNEYMCDKEIIDIYQLLYKYSSKKIPNNFWSLRLSFNIYDLEYVDITMEEIANIIENSINCDHIIYNNDNSDKQLFIRILINNIEEDDDENIEDSIINELRKIESNCMSLKLKGFEGVDYVYTRKSKINNWTPEDGIINNTQWILETEGSNLLGSFELNGIDHTKSITNNILEIYTIFGIEAARQGLLNELRTVLSFDGSYVNYRHLSILVDVMTCRGSILAMTRHGINRVDTNVLTKCSFEETVDVLTDAAAFGEYDPLKGISDNIMLGQVIPAGTGSFEVLYDFDMKPDVIVREPTPRLPTPGIDMSYIPSEPNYDPLSLWSI